MTRYVEKPRGHKKDPLFEKKKVAIASFSLIPGTRVSKNSQLHYSHQIFSLLSFVYNSLSHYTIEKAHGKCAQKTPKHSLHNTCLSPISPFEKKKKKKKAGNDVGHFIT